MPVLEALAAYSRRTYGGWDETHIEWDGRTLPPRFLRWSRRLRTAWPTVEERADDSGYLAESFLYHYLLGLRYGYPECCVMAYATTAPLLPVARERRVAFLDYVPCPACLDRFLEGYHGEGPTSGPFPVGPA